MTTPTPAATTRPPSVWEDAIDIFFKPSQVFERRRDDGFGMALLILWAATVVIFFATLGFMQPVYDAILDKSIAMAQSKGQANPDAVAAMRKFGGTMFKVTAVLITPILVFLYALFIWLAGKLVGATEKFGQAMMISTYSHYPLIPVSILGALVAMMTSAESVTSQYAAGLSPARLLGPDAPLWEAALLSRFEPQTIWTTILLGIGLSVVGKVSRQKGQIAAWIVWLALALWTVGSAMRAAS